MKQITGLDGVRALSALAVAAMHFGVLDAGWVGVQFFYVLSGFLITSKLLEDKTRFRSLGPYLLHFYKRRSLRIMPLYFLYLLVVIAGALLSHTLRHDLAELPYLQTYTYNFRRGLSVPLPGVSLAPHLWSLSVEEQFYVFWPFLIFFCSRRRAMFGACIAVCAAPLLRLAYLLVAGHSAATGYVLYFLTPFQIDGFAMGALLSFIPLESLKRWRLHFASVVTLLTFLGLIANRHLATFGLLWVPRPRVAVWLYTVIDLVGAWLVVECVLNSRLARSLDLQPLRFLGRVSYGFYVWHIVALVALQHLVPLASYSLGMRSLLFILYACAVSGLATLSYHLYEKPVMAVQLRSPSPGAPQTRRRSANKREGISENRHSLRPSHL